MASVILVISARSGLSPAPSDTAWQAVSRELLKPLSSVAGAPATLLEVGDDGRGSGRGPVRVGMAGRHLEHRLPDDLADIDGNDHPDEPALPLLHKVWIARQNHITPRSGADAMVGRRSNIDQIVGENQPVASVKAIEVLDF
jgi:hypothetical protein